MKLRRSFGAALSNRDPELAPKESLTYFYPILAGGSRSRGAQTGPCPLTMALFGLTAQPGSPTAQAIAERLRSKDGNGNCSCRVSDIDHAVSLEEPYRPFFCFFAQNSERWKSQRNAT